MVGPGGYRDAFAAEELVNLAARVVGPGAAVIELDIGAPVAQGAAVFAGAFVGECQVVVGVGVAGRERDGLEVGGDGFLEALELVENVAEIEVGENITRVGLGGAAVEFLCAAELALVEDQRAQVYAGCGILRIDGQNFLVEIDGALLLAGFLGLNRGVEALL